jgi:hypothetical protein
MQPPTIVKICPLLKSYVPYPSFNVNCDGKAFDWLFQAIYPAGSSEFRSCDPTRILKIVIRAAHAARMGEKRNV